MELTGKCEKCKSTDNELLYHCDDGWFCSECAWKTISDGTLDKPLKEW